METTTTPTAEAGWLPDPLAPITQDWLDGAAGHCPFCLVWVDEGDDCPDTHFDTFDTHRLTVPVPPGAYWTETGSAGAGTAATFAGIISLLVAAVALVGSMDLAGLIAEVAR